MLIRKARSDHQGEGRLIAIHANRKEPHFCPAVAFAHWMEVRKTGPD
jgi:hypothetical protein